MTKASGATLADPLLARKGEAAPTGYRRDAALAADAANSNGATDGAATAPAAGPAPAADVPLLEPGEQASLLTCVPLKASFVGLDTPDSDEAAPAAPTVAPLAAQPETVTAASATAEPEPPAVPQTRPAPEQDSLSRRLLIVLALAALVALAWYGLKSLSQEPVTAPVEPLQEPAAAAPEPPAEPLAEPLAEPAPADAPPPAAVADPIPAGTAPQPIEPSFDVVRIEPNGDAVIVGRGPAFSDLVVLDNGTPIGTVTADADGQWILIPEAPLNQGGHNFSLAVKSDSSTVILPAPGPGTNPDAGAAGETPALQDPAASDAPAAGDQSRLETEDLIKRELQKLAAAEADSLSAPLPASKPALPDALGAAGKLEGAYEIQMVSVPSEDGASREMQRLKDDFPDLLANLDLRIDAKSYSDQRQRYRVRTGPFADKTAAEALCQRLTASQQDCLVLKR